jgi:catalytic LigB subunit of aromatic ring-opening dioxygenase
MAKLSGCLAMSHGPQLMLNPSQWHLLGTRAGDKLPAKAELEKETEEVKWDKWRRCMDAIALLRAGLEELSPDVVIVVGDDQHENILEDNTPPFTVFIGAEAEASTSLKYLGQSKSENRARYAIDTDLGRTLLSDLMDAGFDPAYSKNTRYEGGLGHAFARVLKFLTPNLNCRILPIMVNTYFPPAPSPKRCVQFGRALAGAIRRSPGDRRVAVIASGGLSHTKINEALDQEFLDKLKRNDVDGMAQMAASLFVEGTSEILNWIVVAAAADQKVEVIDYQPLYRTKTGVGCAMGFAWWKLNHGVGLAARR